MYSQLERNVKLLENIVNIIIRNLFKNVNMNTKVMKYIPLMF